MRLKLSQRFNLYIGGILFAGICLLFFFDYRSNRQLLEEIGIGEAERLCETIFDQLYTSMRLGGGRKENRAIIERFRKMDGIRDIRVIHGGQLDRQYGIEEDEIPVDAMDRDGLEGRKTGILLKDADGGLSARVVQPFFIQDECMRCHTGRAGQVNGAISVTMSLRKYGDLIAGHMRSFLIWGGGILLLTSSAILFTVHKRLLVPIEALRKGAEALASGDLAHRVRLITGDELEELGEAFDKMASSLHAAASGLKEINEKHSKLVQMAPDAIVLRDYATDRLVDANPAAEIMTGYSREALIGMRSPDLFPVEKLPEYREVFKRWCHDGKGYLHNGVIIKNDGFTVPVEIGASVLELGGKKYIQEIWRDLSERKGFEDTIRRHVAELEETVRERTAELNKSLVSLETAYKRLQDSEQKFVESAKLISLGEMAASIAHELNSPLAGILSITEVLIGRLHEGDPNRNLLYRIKDATVRSKYIILDMMTYARPSKEGFTPMFLNEAVRATLTLFISEIKTSSLEIEEDLDMVLPKVLGNRGQIMEVILNIIKNARDAMGGAGKIYISTRVANGGGFALLEIRDTGPGIPKAIIGKIFDPFFTTKEKGGGLNIGLGLSISKSIINGHGGRIEAENGVDRGASFRVYLPLAPAEETENLQ